VDEDRAHAQSECGEDVVFLPVPDHDAATRLSARSADGHLEHGWMWFEAAGIIRGDDGVHVVSHPEKAEVLPVASGVAPVGVARDDRAQAEGVGLGEQLECAGQGPNSIRDRERHRAANASHRVRVSGDGLAYETAGDEVDGIDGDIHLRRDRSRFVPEPAAFDEVDDQRFDGRGGEPGQRAGDPFAPAAGVCGPKRPRVGPECAADVDEGGVQGSLHAGLIIASMLRWLTAGESHGPQLTVVIEGLPAGLAISEDDLRRDLARRQGGHGRGGRQKIETDFARIVSGVRGGYTIGSPVTLVLENKDHVNWTAEMTASTEGFAPKPVTRLRPGHADLAGALKYGHTDVRNVLERSSARETATRVAAGGVARKLLGQFGVEILSFTQSIGRTDIGFEGVDPDTVTVEEIEGSPVRCPDPEASRRMVADIDEVGERGDTLGGSFRIIARGVPLGLGSYVHWDRKLDGRLAQAVLSINAIKGVEFGAGFEGSARPGSEFHDQIDYEGGKFRHLTNRAGGLTGGVTNGEPIDLRVAIKPISTMKKPMQSIDLKTKEKVEAHYERSDVCVVPAAGVIGEAVVALTLADAFLEKFGGDSMAELERNYRSYMESIGL
jgi:chorismate synthase